MRRESSQQQTGRGHVLGPDTFMEVSNETHSLSNRMDSCDRDHLGLRSPSEQ